MIAKQDCKNKLARGIISRKNMKYRYQQHVYKKSKKTPNQPFNTNCVICKKLREKIMVYHFTFPSSS